MTSRQTYRAQTSLADVRIERHGDELQLKFDSDREAIQTAINTLHPQRLCMENLRYLMGILLFLPTPRNILLLGVGGGSLVQFFHYYLPETHITGVEYDADLLAIAQQRMGLPLASERLTYVITDAHDYLRHCETEYDLVVVDIFDGGQSPHWLLQKQTLQQLKACLSDKGAVAYNLLIDNEQTFSRYYKLLRQVFQQQTLCLETDDYENLLVYGLNFTRPPRNMAHWLDISPTLTEQYELPFAQILARIYDINPVNSGII